ncbi:hypothetical protein EH223_10700 [candidate division KSB1 bacterium]|nr:hypothetical protein [candidate division KSB1 bacterium]RQW03223.1 MAG: hypothetical protein EH223_10700 [candidate division KSB1 bacterium]
MKISANSFGDGDYDMWLLKTDAHGDTLWTKNFGGLEQDEAFVVEQTADGGYILSTYSYSYGAGGSDIYLIRTDENGDVRWTKTIGGWSNEAGRILIQTPDGEFIAGGSTASYGAG